MSDPARRRGVGFALASAAFTAVFLLTFRGAGDEGHTGFVVALFLVSMIANLSWSVAKPGARLRLSRFEHGIALAIAVFTVLGNVCIGLTTRALGPGLAGVVVQTEIFLVAVLSALFLRERLTARMLLGAVLAVGGIVLLRLPGVAQEVDGTGVVWGVVAALSFALILVVTRAVIDRIDAEGVNGFRLVYAVPATLLLPGGFGVFDLSLRAWCWAIGAGLAGPFLSRLFLMHALKALPAAETRLLILSTPVFAFALDFAIFGAIPSLAELGAAALILGGVALPVLLRVLRRRSRPPSA